MISVYGVGLHSGQGSTVRFFAEPGPVRFRSHGVWVAALASHVVDTTRCTVLGAEGQTIALVEHLLAALSLRHIWDGLVIEIDGPEIPILDGSAQGWLETLADFPASAIGPVALTEAFKVAQDRSEALAAPSASFSLTATIAFPHPKIGYQKIDCPPVPLLDLAPARTFGFLSELEALQAAGLALGATMDNVLAFSEADAIVPLRMGKEPVYHKALDFLGDLYLAGKPLLGSFAAHRGSHTVHVALARQLQQWLGLD
jgi:UDP-3-O-[3-hydroxymyristoyl] N-acetylglucosamine deacetylase